MSAAMNKTKQALEESHGERVARKDSDFPSIEKSLPHAMGSPFSIPLLDKASSWLGLRNPLARQIDPKQEEVWILDNTAYRPIHVYPHAKQPWQAEYVAAYFKKNSGEDVSDAVANIAEKIGLGSEGEDKGLAEQTISDRLQLFVATIAPARRVDVKILGGGTKRLGPGGRSAVSEQIVTGLGEHSDGESVSVEAIPAEIAPHGHATTHFAEPEGWMVISDIDDTTKITLTSSPIGILRSTFVSTPCPIPGMPDLYTRINKLLHPTWFYLSASPYNLYPFLRPFLRKYYPAGTILLREASWQDIGNFLATLTQGTEAYKVAEMVKLHTMLPKRKVLCVGDSTQSDPEAYGEIHRRFGGKWVKRIFIRKVVGVEGMDAGVKNSEERFEKAFRGVPRDVWTVFEDPGVLHAEVEKLRGME